MCVYATCMHMYEYIHTHNYVFTNIWKYVHVIKYYILFSVVCDCDTLGATSSTCESYGGQCYCKANVIGRQCDRCAAGSFDLSIMGCKGRRGQ